MREFLIVHQLIAHLFPALNLVDAAAWIFIERNVEAFDQLRIAALDKIRMILRVMFGGFRNIIAELQHHLEADHIVMLSPSAFPLRAA